MEAVYKVERKKNYRNYSILKMKETSVSLLKREGGVRPT